MLKSNFSDIDPELRVRELMGLYGAPDTSTAHLLCDRHDPGKIAFRIVKEDLTATDLTYGKLREESERFASALYALGIRPGDRVATLMGKGRNLLVTLMGIWRLGAVHVPLFTAFAPAAIAFRLNRSRAKLVVTDKTQQGKLAPGGDIPLDPSWRIVTTESDGDIPKDALLFSDLMAAHEPGFPAAALGGDAPIIEIYTSGTTGTPKGVVWPLKGLAACQIYGEYALGLREDDVFWNAADPGWAYGLHCGVVLALMTGIEGILFEGGFSPAATLSILSRYGVTNFTAAPTVYRALRASGLTPPPGLKLRCASGGGEPQTPEINEWAVQALGIPVHDHYGQSECGMLINNNHHPAVRQPLKQGSMGQTMPGWKAVILKHDRDKPAPIGEVGRVAFDLANSPLACFRGYRDEPAKTAEKFSSDGRWYFSGDTARMDEEGYFYFSSRDDDVIIMAGYRIGPFEVESVLLSHPKVGECAVVAVPDGLKGEVLVAAVVPRDGATGTPALTEELQTLVKTKFAAHAYPRAVHYVASLPKTPTGKIQRYIIRQHLGGRAIA
jgi:acetyl-CoA synthetase